MMNYRLKIADTVFLINSCYEKSFELCKDYVVTDQKADVFIQTTQTLIDLERQVLTDVHSFYTDELVEYYLICRLLSDYFLNNSTLLMHGVALAVNSSSCYLFTAPSGTGKTTHSNLWLNNLPDAFIVNGDKPFLKIRENDVLAYGSPWAGKERTNTNCSVPVKGICILERGENNSITEISYREAFPYIYQQTYHPYDYDNVQKVLILLNKLSLHVKFYKMQMNNYLDDAFITSYKVMVKYQKSGAD